MRVPVQGCLILLLCLFSSTSFGAVVYDGLYNRAHSCTESIVPPDSDCVEGEADTTSSYRFYRYYCTDPSEVLIENGVKTGTGYSLPNYECGTPPPECDSPNYLDPNTGECLPPKTPDQCRELGKAFDTDTSQCVDQCDGPMLDGMCLTKNPEEPDCTPDSENYRGDVPMGYGGSAVPICGDLSCTTGGKPGQAGVFNNELVCLAEDYGAPKCKGESITVIDEYGFVCEPLDNQPEEPQVAEDPNTDTNGDGTPDEYQRKNDPESIDKGLDNVAKKIDQNNDKTDLSNQHLDNIENAVKGMADNVASLEKMGKNGELAGGGGGSVSGLQNDNGDDYLGDLADIKQNTKDTADTLNEIKDGPQDGYNTDGLGDAPTFEQSTDRLQAAITQNPTIEAVTSIPSIATNETCPVWTIPATDFWEATPMDVHCDILNQYRGLFSALFTAVWTLAAVFVFLRA